MKGRGAFRPIAIGVLAFALTSSAPEAGLPQSQNITLPSGVAAVWFGKAQRYKDASGKEMCAIVEPLATPAFDRGVTEISYGVSLQPKTVKSAAARVVAPAGQVLRSVPCNAFTPVVGGFSQTQLGSTISRVDKQPLVSGVYQLRVTVDGQTAELSFSVR